MAIQWLCVACANYLKVLIVISTTCGISKPQCFSVRSLFLCSSVSAGNSARFHCVHVLILSESELPTRLSCSDHSDLHMLNFVNLKTHKLTCDFHPHAT